ncbi:LysR family transcriptional regulator [uncultured Roseobacter sp.]|uniref:LysR family transcriptional regulator n=1 Tax=uncultured Roseobacter sp. TaxID=114847 RepID=UPI00261A6DCE|nr:LysR family transcriptional regulator [uncultured Roseobacter sp.]
MIDQLRQIAIFAKAVDHGSFRAAAKALRLSPSVVSHHITHLEEQLGVALLYRSTRKLSLTRDGERLIGAARAMIDAAEAGLNAISDMAAQPSGVLRVTAPAVLAQSSIVKRMAEFSIAHPGVRLNLDFSDLRREVIGDGIDVALRMGWLEDSALKARKLYDVDRCLVAASSYLSTRPTPDTPKDVEHWDWVELTQVKPMSEFQKAGHQPELLKPAARLSVNDAHALYHLARSGAGLAIVPDFLMEEDAAAGVVRHVLPDWSVAPVGVFAVWPPNAPKEGLTSLFVKFLAEAAH